MVLLHLHCPSGASLTLRSLSHCLQLIRHTSRQLLCPSCHLIHYVLRSAPLHHVRSLTICSEAWQPVRQHKAELQGCTNPFASHTTILTGFHSATLRPSFISVAFSPPAANNFARLAYHRLRYGAALTHDPCSCTDLDTKPKSACHVPPLHCASIRGDAPFTVRPSRWCSQPLPFVPHSSGF
jgi:hypothetical protein